MRRENKRPQGEGGEASDREFFFGTPSPLIVDNG